MKFPSALGLAVSLVLTASTQARDIERELESVVVTGSYTPLALGDFTASITVLDERRLRQLNKRQLGDVLRMVPGLLIERQGGSGGLTAVSVRGGEPNFTQVLLDGIPLNDPTNSRGGSYDVGNLSSTSVSRIEVVRGPQSAVYGSDALAGVINLITHDPNESSRPSLRVELGEDGYHDYRIAGGFGGQDQGASLTLGKREDGDLVRGSSREVNTANLHQHWQPGDGHRLSAQVLYLAGERSSFPEQSGGPKLALGDELDRSDYTDVTAGLTWDAELTDTWHSRVTASHFDHRETFYSPGVAPYTAVPPNGSETDFERTQLIWLNTLSLSSDYQIGVGADYRDESGVSTGFLDFGAPLPTDYRLSRETTGVFIDLHAQPLPQLLLQASARGDDPDDFDSKTTLRLGASYQLSPSLQLAANWGEGFKLPSFFALGHALVGNPALQPETARGWDTGLQWQPSPAVAISASVFFNRYRDLVDFDAQAFTNVNRGEVETRGSEWQLEWQPSRAMTLAAHATYTDIDVIGEDATLLGRPQWQAGAWFGWRLSDRWQTGLDYEWTDRVPASSLDTGQTVITSLKPFYRLDWRLGWEPMDALLLELAVDNLTDEGYQTAVGFPAPGRNLRLAVTLRLGS